MLEAHSLSPAYTHRCILHSHLCAPPPPPPPPPHLEFQPAYAVHIIIVVCGILGIAFSIFNYFLVAAVKLPRKKTITGRALEEPLTDGSGDGWQTKINFIYEAVTAGAQTFLFEEYKVRPLFIPARAWRACGGRVQLWW